MKGGLDRLKGCSDVPGINSTCLDVVSTREVSPNVVEKLTALVPTNYELPSTSIVVVSDSNKVSDEENPMLSNEIVHKNSGVVKDRIRDSGLTGEDNFAQREHSDGEFKMGWVIPGPLKKGDFERLKRKGRPKKFNNLLGESSLRARKGDVKKGKWARHGNRAIESLVSVESADLLGLKRKSSLVTVETQDVGDTEKKKKGKCKNKYTYSLWFTYGIGGCC